MHPVHVNEHVLYILFVDFVMLSNGKTMCSKMVVTACELKSLCP